MGPDLIDFETLCGFWYSRVRPKVCFLLLFYVFVARGSEDHLAPVAHDSVTVQGILNGMRSPTLDMCGLIICVFGCLVLIVAHFARKLGIEVRLPRLRSQPASVALRAAAPHAPPAQQARGWRTTAGSFDHAPK